MRFIKLRICFSLTCGIACVLLVVLWVRSYWRFDGVYIFREDNGGISLFLTRGDVNFSIDLGSPFWIGELEVNSRPAVGKLDPSLEAHGFVWQYPAAHGTTTTLYLKVPYWFLVMLFAILAALPWLRWRFSLRTLLIATTLVALVLGLVVWLR